jgi:hypothetical protein
MLGCLTLDKWFSERTKMDGMNGFAFSEEDAEKAMVEVKKMGRFDRRVCACGHSLGRHQRVDGGVVCSFGKQSCPFQTIRPVLEASNTKTFMRKTMGTGPLHALGSGAFNAMKNSETVEWIVDLQCDYCSLLGPIIPCAVNDNGKIVDEATGIDVLLCRKCVEDN